MYHEALDKHKYKKARHLPNASENRQRVGEKAHNVADPLLEFFVLRAEHLFEGGG